MEFKWDGPTQSVGLERETFCRRKASCKGCSHWDCWGRLDSYQKTPGKGTTTQVADEPMEHEAINPVSVHVIKSVSMLNFLMMTVRGEPEGTER